MNTAPQSRREDGRTYSVFIAGASDCDELRSIAKRAFEDHNFVAPSNDRKFAVFDWREDKTPGYAGEQFQEQVFQDAARLWGKEECDIFVLLLWYKFGEDTKREYDAYMAKRADGSLPHFFVCHYNEPVPPLDLMDCKIDSLFEWITQHRSGWAELDPTRGAVNEIVAYQAALYKRINSFLSEQAD
ncbi:MAG: hypothetical protein AAF718_00275 [Pseudomonadota bacterium]